MSPPLAPAACSQVYTAGELLHTIQLARIYDDSKSFVDKRQLQSEADTLEIFTKLMTTTKGQPSQEDVLTFVDDAFEDGNELEEWTAPDFNPTPHLLSTIRDPELKEWASHLNELWKTLTRKMKDDVRVNQERYSILYAKNGFVVPGGRFREFYYWDTYWIMLGLLKCEMYVTARGVIENFVNIVEQVGFVPNGGRVYYLTRSQPPMLTPMMMRYVEATGDIDFFVKSAAALEKEYNFWLTERTVQIERDGINHTVARYFVKTDEPRPESYSEDVELAKLIPVIRRKQFFQDIRSAAESGWDFSTRWFINNNGTNEGNLSNIRTQSIIPVDLNALIHWTAETLSELFSMAGNCEQAEYYKRQAVRWKTAIEAVLWHEDLGIWLDYDLLNNKRREYFYISNMVPLFTHSYNQDQSVNIANKVINYLKKSGALEYPGGIPASLINSGEQWDLPNAWPNLQHMVILGLDQTLHPPAQELAFKLAQQWVHANYVAYNARKMMYEKYDAVTPGDYGGGGEYIVQAGFGWTNGVMLDLLSKYGEKLCADDVCGPLHKTPCLCKKKEFPPLEYPY